MLGSYNQSPTGADIVSPVNAQCPVLHIMAGSIPGKHSIYADVISFPVLGMYLLLPDITGAVHVFRWESKGIHRDL